MNKTVIVKMISKVFINNIVKENFNYEDLE